ncbi:hypothetical protein [Paenibacillus sp. R14(2021)]|uniref:hypothetical protein n=1 Tax=Paenibacillus sp. R14(2021) TaxID=2859228 RepID=UPI001C616595|nr:hypothetical protein [Paenibacillus sp. R14(2021)]
MPISFTKALIHQLEREIADIESRSMDAKNKIERAQSKRKQLQRDMKLSQSHSDLSSKMTRMNKLDEEIKSAQRLQAELFKQAAAKKHTLEQQLAKTPRQQEPGGEQ